ncbi:MAG: hypothetical protein ACREQN_13385, partial [Candidatus Binataceae bacterium]
IDANMFHPGPWNSVLRAARALPRSERAGLATGVSRVSRKLHQRGRRRTVTVATGLGVEIAVAIIGAILLLIGTARGSDLFVVVAAITWSITFQPLIKIAIGYLVGIDYEYAYLYHVEPRFKMDYGKYLAAPQWARIVLHLMGMVGSPLGAWLPTIFISRDLAVAIYLCRAIFWIAVAINLIAFFPALFGIRRIGSFRLALSSGGMAADEIRNALEI